MIWKYDVDSLILFNKIKNTEDENI